MGVLCNGGKFLLMKLRRFCTLVIVGSEVLLVSTLILPLVVKLPN